jgi:hypothetical protein
MNGFLALLLGLHGVAHLVGFVAAFGLREDVVHSTTLLFGRVDIGEAGSRAMGVLWLAVAVAFVVAGAATWARTAWWPPLTLSVAAVSSLLCLLALPEARIGLPVNALIVVFTLLGVRWGWMVHA